MSGRFSVIEGGGGGRPESKVLTSALEKIKKAIEPFTIFNEIGADSLDDFVEYIDMSDADLAYQVELLCIALREPGGNLASLLARADTVGHCIAFRLQSK